MDDLRGVQSALDWLDLFSIAKGIERRRHPLAQRSFSMLTARNPHHVFRDQPTIKIPLLRT